MIEEAGNGPTALASTSSCRPKMTCKSSRRKRISRIQIAMRRSRNASTHRNPNKRKPQSADVRPRRQSTQMIVGATPTMTPRFWHAPHSLYSRQRLRRVYYSAFSPIPDASSKLPLVAPPLVREHRLYQADWLMRFYGFKGAELTTRAEPDLPPPIQSWRGRCAIAIGFRWI